VTRTNKVNSVKKKRIALTNTQRSQRRRAFLKKAGVTDIKIETTFAQKEVFKRVSVVEGFSSVSQYVVLTTMKRASRLGIHCSEMNKESELGQQINGELIK
jgi:molybdenum cofactor biosynthesis enzyme MoaA